LLTKEILNKRVICHARGSGGRAFPVNSIKTKEDLYGRRLLGATAAGVRRDENKFQTDL
jgi:hypothetical protein